VENAVYQAAAAAEADLAGRIEENIGLMNAGR
jgi:hypothetical protein